MPLDGTGAWFDECHLGWRRRAPRAPIQPTFVLKESPDFEDVDRCLAWVGSDVRRIRERPLAPLQPVDSFPLIWGTPGQRDDMPWEGSSVRATRGPGRGKGGDSFPLIEGTPADRDDMPWRGESVRPGRGVRGGHGDSSFANLEGTDRGAAEMPWGVVQASPTRHARSPRLPQHPSPPAMLDTFLLTFGWEGAAVVPPRRDVAPRRPALSTTHETFLTPDEAWISWQGASVRPPRPIARPALSVVTVNTLANLPAATVPDTVTVVVTGPFFVVACGVAWGGAWQGDAVEALGG